MVDQEGHLTDFPSPLSDGSRKQNKALDKPHRPACIKLILETEIIRLKKYSQMGNPFNHTRIS